MRVRACQIRSERISRQQPRFRVRFQPLGKRIAQRARRIATAGDLRGAVTNSLRSCDLIRRWKFSAASDGR